MINIVNIVIMIITLYLKMEIILLNLRQVLFSKTSLISGLLIFCFSSHYSYSKDLLILHSGFQGELKTQEIQKGIEKGFKDVDWSLYTYYLNNEKTMYSEQETIASANLIEDKFKAKEFDAVIVSGENALRLMQYQRHRLFFDTPIIYAGMKPNDKDLSSFIHKISAVVASESLFETVQLSVTLFPKSHNVFIISNDPSRRSFNEKIVQLLSQKLNQRLIILNNESKESLKEVISHIADSDILIFNDFIVESHDPSLSHPNLLKTLVSITKAPVFVTYKRNLIEGVLGGVVSSLFLQGKAAASKVTQILEGGAVSRLPSEITLENELLLQYSELSKRGLQENDLPNHSILINPPHQEYRSSFGLTACLLLISIFVIGWQRSKYKKLNKKSGLIKIQAQRIENIFNVSYDFIFILDLTGTIKNANRSALAFVDLNKDQVEGEMLWNTPWWINDEFSKKKLKSALGQARVGKTARFECELINHHKERRAFDVFIQSVKGDGVEETNEITSIIVEARDISSIKAIEEEAEKANKRSNLLLDESPSMLLMLNAQGLILSCNKFGCNLLGYIDGELIGRNLVTLYSESLTIDSLKSYLEDCANNQEMVQTREISYATKNGRKIWINERVRKIEGHDQYFLVCENITERYELSKELNYRASHDYLTGLKNRLFFESELDRTLKDIENKTGPCCLMYLDMDKFKIINDTCGHHAGDEVLRQIATILVESVPENSVVARLGGDEFAIILNDTELAEAEKSAETIVMAIGKHYFLWEGHNFTLGISIGLADITDFWRGGVHALSCVDSACYIAKQSGRNRIHIYEEDKQEELRRQEVVWVNKVQDALRDESRFCLYAQLIKPVDGDEKYLHYEILTRMIDENGELAPPEKFIPVAESYNLADKIDLIIITKALSWLKNHPDHVSKLTMCSINLSGQSLGDPEFIDNLVGLLTHSSLPLEKLCFEITETVAIGNFSNASKLINSLKKLGCRLALDDFGTGLSSFGYLKRLNVDYLKIDGVFVKDMANDKQDFGIVKTIHELSHLFGKKTIAEYVESEEIIEKLKEIGVDYAQGYHLGRPIPIDMMALFSDSLYSEDT